MYVELEPGIEALIPSHELSADMEGKKLKRGDAIPAHVMNLDVGDKRILLTQRVGAASAAKAAAESARSESGESTPKVRHSAPPPAATNTPKRAGTLGDLIKEKLGDQLADVVKTDKDK